MLKAQQVEEADLEQFMVEKTEWVQNGAEKRQPKSDA